jgi:hypothetical protein
MWKRGNIALKKKYLESLKETGYLGGLICKWEDSSDISVKGERFEGVSWIYLAQDKGIVLL